MIIINIAGVALIGLIVWWFWLYKPSTSSTLKDDTTIEVKDGVYSPSVVQVPANKPVTLRFALKDQSPCAEMLLIPDLDVSEQLKFAEVTKIKLTDLAPGEYDFNCQMKMYRGILKVV